MTATQEQAEVSAETSVEAIVPEESTETEKAAAMQITAAEQAAIDFHHMLPIFLKKLETLPKKATARLIRQMIEFPLNEKPYVFKNSKEREMFFVARKLLDANLIMAAEVLQMKTEGEKSGETQMA